MYAFHGREVPAWVAAVRCGGGGPRGVGSRVAGGTWAVEVGCALLDCVGSLVWAAGPEEGGVLVADEDVAVGGLGRVEVEVVCLGRSQRREVFRHVGLFKVYGPDVWTPCVVVAAGRPRWLAAGVGGLKVVVVDEVA